MIPKSHATIHIDHIFESKTLSKGRGIGRSSTCFTDKKNFLVIARGSAFECVAILDVLKDEGIVREEVFTDFYGMAEGLSKMLYAMIQKLSG